MEILPTVERLHFDLQLSNLSFLAETWELPERITFELVPTTDLGLMICSVGGRIVVSKVKNYSIAGEDGKVEKGDVIDELDSTPTCGLPPESVADVVKRCQRRPLKVKMRPIGNQRQVATYIHAGVRSEGDLLKDWSGVHASAPAS